MNEETRVVKEIISDIILERITIMMEEMSTNEFVDDVITKIGEETDLDIDDDMVRDNIVSLTGDQILPLLNKMSEYFIDVNKIVRTTT